MKATNRLLILLFILLANTLIVLGQSPLEKKVTVKFQNVSLDQALERISKASGVHFSYSDDLISLNKKVTINAVQKPLKSILDELLKETNIKYTVSGKQVVLYPDNQKKSKR